MPLPLDARLRDDAVLNEIELTSTLMIVASQYDKHLTDHEVDRLLDLC